VALIAHVNSSWPGPASPSDRLAGQTRVHAVGSRGRHDRSRIKIFHQLCARSAVIVIDEGGGMKRGAGAMGYLMPQMACAVARCFPVAQVLPGNCSSRKQPE
jgi:hypothetical protein